MTVLELAEVSFSYRRRLVLRGISFSVAPGEVVGLMGQNGAGKSTILKAAAGLLSPERGKVTVGGKAIGAYGGKERARLVAYLPQTLDQHAPFRVGELVRMGRYPHGGGQALPVEEALGIVGLQGKAARSLAEISGGERRRAYLAMTLVQGAKVLLLDEPLASLDIKYQFDLYRLLRKIAREQGVSVLTSLHDIGMGALLDRLVMVKDGAVVAQGDPGSVLSEEVVQEVYDLSEPADLYLAGNGTLCRAFAAEPRQEPR